MKQVMYFRLPKGAEQRAGLVRELPGQWSWLLGELRAPKELTESGVALEDTGYRYTNTSGIPEIAGRRLNAEDENNARANPQHALMVCKGFRAGFVEFNVNTRPQPNGLEPFLAERLPWLIADGHKGWITLYRSSYRGDRFQDSDLNCDLRIGRWQGRGLEAGPQPSRLRLSWNDSYVADEAVGLLVNSCERLRLERYSPTTNTAVRVH